MKKGGRERKERRSFTLSRESIALLTELSAARDSSGRRSASAVLDELLRSLNKERKRRAVEQAVTRFYDGVSEQAQREDKEWAEFSLAEFLDGTA
jgi:predicted glycosyltransferase